MAHLESVREVAVKFCDELPFTREGMSTQPIGLQDALSRIEQIQTYQQQLSNPTAALGQSGSAAASSATSAASGTSGSSSSTAGGDFASLLSALQTEDDVSGASSDSTAGFSATGSAPVESSLLSSLTGGTSGTSTDSLLLSLLSDLSAGSATSGGSQSTPALGTAEASGIDSIASSGGASAGTDANLPSAVQNMISEADSLIGKPYVWGGGHDGWGAQSGYDCSGFVSAVLHAGGYLSSPQDTQTLANSPGITSGPGQYVTIYDRTDAGVGNDHVIIDINGQFYESGGEQGPWGGGAGVMKIGTPSADYLKTFNRILHPVGL